MISAARTVVSFGILFQFAGFAKLLIIAKYFGAGALLDGYYLALVIPTFLTSVSSGFVQAAFVPAYVRARASGATGTARSLANSTLTWIAIGLGAVAGLLDVTRGLAEPIVASGASPETRAALRDAFAILVWSAPLNAVADAAALVLNAEGKFSVAASAPLANVIVSVVVLIAGGDWTVAALVWSLLAGLAAQTVIVFVAAGAAGVRLRPQFAFAVLPHLFGNVALPVLLSVAVGNMLPAFLQMLCARAGTGAISAMGYASRLHNSLVQAVVISVSVVLLPHFARLVAEGRDAELQANLRRLFAATLLFSAAAMACVAGSGPTAIRLLLERGHFTVANTQVVASVWLGLTLGILGAAWNNFLFRLFQAQQRVWLIFTICCVLVVTGLVSAWLLLRWGAVGVAIANSAAYTLIMWVSHRRVERTLGRILDRDSRVFIGRAILVNFVAYAISIGWANLVAELGPLAVIAGQLGIVGAANIVVARTPPLNVRLSTLLGR